LTDRLIEVCSNWALATTWAISGRFHITDKRISQQFVGGRPPSGIMNKTTSKEVLGDSGHRVWKLVLGRSLRRADAPDYCRSFVVVPRRFTRQHLHHRATKAPTQPTLLLTYSLESGTVQR